MKPNAFSKEPDRALGAALRRALERPGEAEFVGDVIARARMAGVGSSRAVLGRWAWAAAGAAAVAALLGGVLAGTGSATEPSPSLEASWVAAATGSRAAAALLTAREAPDASIMFASLATN